MLFWRVPVFLLVKMCEVYIITLFQRSALLWLIHTIQWIQCCVVLPQQDVKSVHSDTITVIHVPPPPAVDLISAVIMLNLAGIMLKNICPLDGYSLSSDLHPCSFEPLCHLCDAERSLWTGTDIQQVWNVKLSWLRTCHSPGAQCLTSLPKDGLREWKQGMAVYFSLVFTMKLRWSFTSCNIRKLLFNFHNINILMYQLIHWWQHNLVLAEEWISRVGGLETTWITKRLTRLQTLVGQDTFINGRLTWLC